MIAQKRIVCVIPARLQSSRFPRKMLAYLGGRSLLSWVWDAATSIDIFDDIVFAIDSEEVADVIKSFNGKYIMTDPACKTGTDRLVELLVHGKIEADIWVNWQGDEPFISRSMIVSLLQSINDDIVEMWTLKKRITNAQDIFSVNMAKIVSDRNDYALYFSRAPIPCFRDEKNLSVLINSGVYHKHVGLYAYTANALRKISLMGDSALEDAEKLEMLRFLEYGLKIKLHETDCEVRGIDTPEDLVYAEQLVKRLD